MLLDQTMRRRSTGIEVVGGEYTWIATFREGLMARSTSVPGSRKDLGAAGLSRSSEVSLRTEAIHIARIQSDASGLHSR